MPQYLRMGSISITQHAPIIFALYAICRTDKKDIYIEFVYTRDGELD